MTAREKADITIFGSATLKDKATFTGLQNLTSRISCVTGEGEFVFDKGEETGAPPVKELRKKY